MQCERCTKKKATIFYRENISGRVRALRLCSDCADILEQAGELEDMCDPLSGTLFPLFPAEGGKFQLPFRRISVASSRGTVKKCPLCEMTFGEICDGGLLGCSQCYTVFAEEMGAVVTGTHGGAEHRGRISAGHQSRLERLEKLKSLRTRLREAVAAEAFEIAAELRDEIRSLEALI